MICISIWPFYFRPLGLKPCKDNPRNKYHSYDWFLIMECCWSLLTHNKTFFDILGGWIILKHKFIKQNYVWLTLFLNSASAWDFPSSINLITQTRLFDVRLIFQIIISVQLIKNNLKFLFGYLSIIQGFGNQIFNRIQLTFSKSFILIVFCAFDINSRLTNFMPGRVAQSVGHLTRKSGVPGSMPGLATYFRFSFRFFKKGRCQLLAKVCARSTG